ncbi:hypothetical protein R3W88_025603 [Solanum pinnatisectum]|uniref:Amine oxidase domain-containing protein n=1 Tax=Solanum pinnatisectum TaxID=50273 RepID=A0AAV9M6N0_9SOLN|nr:hypothetical protein R3W88_025603 [Solanum pinnatisectum]
MIREISRFKQDVISYLEALDNNPDIDHNETLGQFIESHVYSEFFQKAYLIPRCASIWSCPIARVLGFSSYYILSFFHDHHLLQLFGLSQLLTVRWRSHINKVKEELEKRGCQIRTGCEVKSVSTNEEGCTITCNNGANEIFDGCIMATHAPDTLDMLGKEATFDETRILGAFQYVHSDTFLHRDKIFLPRDPAAWSACNFLGTINNRGCATYWLNIIQHTLLKWRTSHPVPSVAASKASRELHQIQGKRGIWFFGVYQDGMLRRSCSIWDNPNLLEEEGTTFTFQGREKKCPLKVSLRVHSTQFYWKVATEADICHAPSLHPGRDRHLKTIAGPQANPWPGFLNSAET